MKCESKNSSILRSTIASSSGQYLGDAHINRMCMRVDECTSLYFVKKKVACSGCFAQKLAKRLLFCQAKARQKAPFQSWQFWLPFYKNLWKSGEVHDQLRFTSP
jgi:hypothetical protein